MRVPRLAPFASRRLVAFLLLEFALGASTAHAQMEFAPVVIDSTIEAAADSMRVLVVEKRFAEAAEIGRPLLERAEREHGAQSLEVARVLDRYLPALLNLGLGNTPEVRALAERAVSIREQALGPDHPDLAAALYTQGRLELGQGRLDEGQATLERCLAIRVKAHGPHHEQTAIVEMQLGRALVMRDAPSAAEPFIRRAIATFETLPGDQLQRLAFAWAALGDVLLKLDHYDESESAYRQSLALHEQSGKLTREMGGVWMSLGVLADRRGRWAESEAAFREALRVAETVWGPDHPDVALCLHNLAWTLRARGDFQGHFEAEQRAVKILESMPGDPDPRLPNARVGLARAYADRGDLATAREIWERAVREEEALVGPTHAEFTELLQTYASFLGDAGEYADARRTWERVIANLEASEGGGGLPLVSALRLYGDVLFQMGDRPLARTTLERSLALHDQLGQGTALDRSFTSVTLALLDAAEGRVETARKGLVTALALQESEIGAANPSTESTRRDLARLDLREGRGQQALPSLESVLAARRVRLGDDHPLVAASWCDLAEARLATGDAEGARQAALRSESIGRTHLQLTALSLPERQVLRYAATRPIGLDLALGSLEQASRLAPDSAVAFGRNELTLSRAVVLDEMARRRRALRESGDAQIESLRTEWIFRSAELASLFLRSDRDDPRLTETLIASRGRKEETERALAERSAEFRAQRAHREIRLEDVTRALPEGTALVGYVLYACPSLDKTRAADTARYAAFVMPLEGAAAFVPLGSAGEIDALVADWRGSLARPDEPQAEARCRQLGAAVRARIWDPLEPFTGGAAAVTIVPDGSLAFLDWCALPISDDRYLIDTGLLLHTLTTERDAVVGATTPSGEGLLALGGADFDLDAASAAPEAVSSAAQPLFRGPRTECPDFRSLRFEGLAGAEGEVADISSLWDGSVVRLTGAAATETALKRLAPGRRVLHLATHGFYVDGACASLEAGRRGIGAVGRPAEPSRAAAQPPASPVWVEQPDNPLLLSGLALAGANLRDQSPAGADDGILTAEEVASLDLTGVNLAVLSACDSGLGPIERGEGILGLRRAFQIAGARAVLTSLWPVDDVATRAWMVAFYRARTRLGLDTASAVRSASIERLRARRATGEDTHPFHWAGFVAAGDWR